jgi:Na+/proline symporter
LEGVCPANSKEATDTYITDGCNCANPKSSGVVPAKNALGHLGLYEIIPGFIFSWISIVVVSLMGKAPEAEVVQRFEQADSMYKQAMAEMKEESTQR